MAWQAPKAFRSLPATRHSSKSSGSVVASLRKSEQSKNKGQRLFEKIRLHQSMAVGAVRAFTIVTSNNFNRYKLMLPYGQRKNDKFGKL